MSTRKIFIHDDGPGPTARAASRPGQKKLHGYDLARYRERNGGKDPEKQTTDGASKTKKLHGYDLARYRERNGGKDPQ